MSDGQSRGLRERIGGAELTAQDQAREAFLSIRRALLALGRPANAAEIAELTGLSAAVVTRRLQSNATSNATAAFCWFVKTPDGWTLTGRGRDGPDESST